MEAKKNADSVKRFSPVKRAKSFSHAIRGVGLFLRTTHNAWVQLVIFLIVVLFGIHFNITRTEWAEVVLAAGVVLAAEAVNTAIEISVNLSSPGEHPHARDTKDVAAAAVLIAACAAFVVGLLVFLPYLLG